MCASLYTNPKIDHDTIARYMFAPAILTGLRDTIILAVVSQAIGIALGLVLAIMRLSSNVVLTSVSQVYIWFFRGVPLLVQILIWGNFALLFRHIVVGLPMTDLSLTSWDTNDLITTFVAAILGLGLNEAAYMAEIVRAGISSVDEGQEEAAASLGISKAKILRHVTIPQSMRVIIPPTANQFISMIKATSLVYVIAGGGLLTVAQNISSQNLRVVELLVVASAWFLILTSITSIGQLYLERRFARGTSRPALPSALGRSLRPRRSGRGQ
jgi:polar amino acid transport system permease protein